MMNYLIWFLRIIVPLFAVAAIISSLRAPRTEGLPNGFSRRAIALELPQTPDDVEAIRKVYPDDEIHKDIKGDFAFVIPIYTLIFACLGVCFYKLNFPSAKILGSSLIICALLAAIFDILENLGMLKLLESATQEQVDTTRHTSLVKWGLFGVMMLIISIPFLLRGGWTIALGLLYMVTGLIYLFGLWQHPQIETAATLMILAFLPTGEAIRTVASTFSV